MLSRVIATVLARPRTVVFVWLLAALVSAAVTTSGVGQIGTLGYSVPGSGSARADALLARHIPGDSGTVIYALLSAHFSPSLTGSSAQAMAEQGHTELDRVVRLLRLQRDIASVQAATSIEEPRNRSDTPIDATMVVAIHLDGGVGAAEERVPGLEAGLRATGGRDVSATLAGGVIVARDYSIIARQGLSRAELIALPLTFIALLVAFLSILAAALPVGSAAISLAVTLTILRLVSLHTGLSVFAIDVASVVALGLSVDYALFVVTRYREQRQLTDSVEQALTVAMHTAGRSVLLSGLAIAASLTALLAVGVGLFSSMAIGGILASLVAVLAATTLLPATICLLGDHLDRFTLRPAAAAARRGTLWRWLARVVTTHPFHAAFASVAILLALAIPALSLQLNSHNVSELPRGEPMTRALEDISEQFGPGASGPLEVVTSNPTAARAMLSEDADVRSVSRPTAGSGGWSAMRVALESEPDSNTASAAIARLRHKLREIPGTTYIGGLTAGNIDLTARVASRLTLVVGLALAVGLVALTMGLRSIVIPIKSVLCSLLSVAATLGVLMLCFPSSDGLSFFVPPFIFALVFGLSLDYEVFLLGRVREAIGGGSSTRDSVSLGLIRSGRPITLAGLTVAIVFAAFALSPLLALRQLGLGLAIAVLLDVSVVRCILVPACVVLFGRWNWQFPSLPIGFRSGRTARIRG